MLTVTRKKSPATHEYHLGNTYLKRLLEEKDLGIIISSNLSWDLHVMHIALKANMLGLLKRTCPLITDVKSQADTLSLSSEVTTLLCHRCAVSRKSQIENDRRKSPDRVQLAGYSELKSAKSPTNNDCWLFADETNNIRMRSNFILSYFINFCCIS